MSIQKNYLLSQCIPGSDQVNFSRQLSWTLDVFPSFIFSDMGLYNFGILGKDLVEVFLVNKIGE